MVAAQIGHGPSNTAFAVTESKLSIFSKTWFSVGGADTPWMRSVFHEVSCCSVHLGWSSVDVVVALWAWLVLCGCGWCLVDVFDALGIWLMHSACALPSVHVASGRCPDQCSGREAGAQCWCSENVWCSGHASGALWMWLLLWGRGWWQVLLQTWLLLCRRGRFSVGAVVVLCVRS